MDNEPLQNNKSKEKNELIERERLTCLVGYLKIIFIDNKTQSFQEFHTISLLIDSFLSIIPSDDLNNEFLSDVTTCIKYFPIKPAYFNLTTGPYLSQRFSKWCRKTGEDKDNLSNESDTTWQVMPMRNIIGEMMLESNKVTPQYFKMYPLGEYIEDNKNLVNFRLLIIDDKKIDEYTGEEKVEQDEEKKEKEDEEEKEPKEEEKKVEIDKNKKTPTSYVYPNPFVKQNIIKELPLYSKYHYDKESNEYFFFIDEVNDTVSYTHSGFLVSEQNTILATFKPKNIMTISQFATRFENEYHDYEDVVKNVKTVIIVSPLSTKDASDFKTTINYFRSELNADLGKMNYIDNDYEDMSKLLSINDFQSTSIFWKNFILCGQDFFKRMTSLNRPSIFGSDSDLTIRRLFNARSADADIDEINMSNMKISKTYFNTIMTAISYNSSKLISLNLNNIKMTLDNINNLCDTILNADVLQNIVLSRTNMDYRELYFVVKAIKDKKVKSVKSIDLSYNTFSKGKDKIGSAIKMAFFNIERKPSVTEFAQNDLSFLSELLQVKGLKTLRLDHISNFNLEKNFNKKENTEGMALFLKNCINIVEQLTVDIHTLDLSAFDLSTNDTMYPFCELIKHLSSMGLSNLILENCNINDDTFDILADYITKEKFLYKYFDISMNKLTELSSENLNGIFKIFSTNMKTINTDNDQFFINLSNNKELNYHKSHSGIRRGKMYEEMKFCKRTYLDISNTSIDTETLQAITNIFKANDELNIVSLNISNNKITDEMIVESGFGEITSKSRTLNSVIIQNNNITSEGIKTLFEEKVNNCVILCDDIKDIDNYCLQWIKINSKPKKKKKTKSKKNRIVV